MIFALLINGASVVPLFLPLLPQALLLYLAFRFGRLQELREIPSSALLVPVAFVVLATFAASFSDADNFAKLLKLLLNSLVAVIVVRALVLRYGDRFPSVYAHGILYMSLVGVAGLVLASFSDWHLTANISERAYHTNLLTTWLSDADFDSSRSQLSPFPYRLQSFFDEPGTYGMLLVPAFFYFLDKGDGKKTAITALCVFLSESANAWLFTLLLAGLKLFALRRWKHRLAVVATLLVVGSVIYPDAMRLYEIKVGIDEAYANASSLGTRSLEYAYLMNNLELHFVPLARAQLAYDELGSISSAYVSWYVIGGGIFVFVFIWVMLNVVQVALAARRHNDTLHRFSFVMAVVLFSSGFQRTSFLDNILFMSLFYWSLTQGLRSYRRPVAHAAR